MKVKPMPRKRKKKYLLRKRKKMYLPRKRKKKYLQKKQKRIDLTISVKTLEKFQTNLRLMNHKCGMKI